MKLHIYQYGHAKSLEGLSIGVARQVPRGVRKEDYVKKGYFDVWLPLLAPSRELFMSYRKGSINFTTFAKKYRQEMRAPHCQEVIRLVAAMAKESPVNLGCFCEDENCCHRSVLRKLVMAAGSKASSKGEHGKVIRCASPPCSMPECDD